MKKFLFAFSFMLVLVLSAQPDTTSVAPVAEPSIIQKLAFYGLTAAGLIFLYLSFKRSRWGSR